MRNPNGKLPPLPRKYLGAPAPVVRTAEDIPLTPILGPNVLQAFRVWTDEIDG
jgi:hypothetical protein